MSDAEAKREQDEADLASMKAELQARADRIESIGYIPSDLDDLPDEAFAPVVTNEGDLREDDASDDEEGATGEDEVEATDAAEKLAKELGVDLSEIEGTGADGRVIVSDVQAAAAAKEEE